MASQPRIRVVQVLDAEQPLDLGDAVLGRADRLVLEVDEEVATFLLELRAGLEARHQPGEGEIEVGGFLGLARDDQRGPGLVDEDVVHLVHDRERPLALHPLVELIDHVVAQVVEAELVVGAVGDIGRVRLATRDRAKVDQPLVGRRIAGLVQVGRVVRDHAHRQAQEVVRGAHPLGVAPGEVVVHRDDVGAAAGQAVERGGEGRDQGLALARAHLGDPALVEHDGAHQLDVVLAHAHRALHRLAAGGEHLRDDVIERLLQALQLTPSPGLLEVAAAFEVGVVELVLRRFIGDGGLDQVLADQVDPFADLGVRESLVLGLELVRAIDEGLELGQLAIVAVEKPGQEAHGRLSIG